MFKLLSGKIFQFLVSMVISLILLIGTMYGTSYLKMVTDKNAEIADESFDGDKTDDKIHFLNTGSSDCILIESNGLYALVDCAENSEYPEDKPSLKLQGYEDKVLDYLRKNAADENGNINLEFVLGTHSHSDHIGGFDTIINDENVHIKKAFLKQYNPEVIKDSETTDWDNQEVYDQMLNALVKKGIPVVSEASSEPFSLGDFTIQLFNAEIETKKKNIGENDNSFGVLVTKGEKKAFLAGDIDYLSGDEFMLAKKIGKVNLLKVGHHGYIGSSSFYFIRTLRPEIAVITNDLNKAFPNVLFNLTVGANVSVYATVQNNGVIASFTDNGMIKLTKNIHV